MRLRVAAILMAAAALAAWAETGLPSGRELVFKNESEYQWKPDTALPPGAEYQLIREDPVTRGIQAVVRFPAGYSIPSHALATDETLVVLRGKLFLKAGDSERTLGAADYAAIPAGVAHELRVKGWGSCLVVATTAGPFSLKK